jgi:hypothetical protein
VDRLCSAIFQCCHGASVVAGKSVGIGIKRIKDAVVRTSFKRYQADDQAIDYQVDMKLATFLIPLRNWQEAIPAFR